MIFLSLHGEWLGMNNKILENKLSSKKWDSSSYSSDMIRVQCSISSENQWKTFFDKPFCLIPHKHFLKSHQKWIEFHDNVGHQLLFDTHVAQILWQWTHALGDYAMQVMLMVMYYNNYIVHFLLLIDGWNWTSISIIQSLLVPVSISPLAISIKLWMYEMRPDHNNVCMYT